MYLAFCQWHQLAVCTTKSSPSYVAALQQHSCYYRVSQASSTECGCSKQGKTTHLALHVGAPAGETGKSVSQYSAEWLETVPLMRSVIKGNKPLSNSDVLVRETLHHRALARLSPGGAHPCRRLSGLSVAEHTTGTTSHVELAWHELAWLKLAWQD